MQLWLFWDKFYQFVCNSMGDLKSFNLFNCLNPYHNVQKGYLAHVPADKTL